MSPLAKSLCCLLGIGLAGVPLALFTAPAAPQSIAAAQPSRGEATPATSVPAIIRCSGRPGTVQVWHEGRLLCEASPQGGVWQGVLELPAPVSSSVLELEVQASWPQGHGEPQGVSLELSPQKLPAQQDAKWISSEVNTLHDIFTFKW